MSRSYIRSIQKESNIEYEVDQLGRKSPLEDGTFGGNNPYGQPVEVNFWLAGRAGISTTRYNEGQKHYYSPVGCVFELSENTAIFGSYKGDGNTSTLNATQPRYWQAFEAIRLAMRGGPEMLAAITNKGLAASFATDVTNSAEANTLRGRIEQLLSADDVLDSVKASIRQCVIEAARTALQGHYCDPDKTKEPLGTGLNPDGLTALEQQITNANQQVYADATQGGREIKYTESQIHGDLTTVIGTYYTVEQGSYPDIITDDWRTAQEWLENRTSAALDFKTKLEDAGVNNAKLMKLENGVLVHV